MPLGWIPGGIRRQRGNLERAAEGDALY